VLKPHPRLKKRIHEREVKNKFKFFSKLYIEQPELFTFDTNFIDKDNQFLEDYRMILPLVSGIPYDKVDITDPKTQWSLLQSGVKAIQYSHKNKNLIVIDINKDNIFYNEEIGTSYLIDGGLSAEIGAVVYPEILKKPILMKLRVINGHIFIFLQNVGVQKK
jgi:serine/threonine protein kinase